jgi:uncharacterized protein YodC (DUF2158 family)
MSIPFSPPPVRQRLVRWIGEEANCSVTRSSTAARTLRIEHAFFILSPMVTGRDRFVTDSAYLWWCPISEEEDAMAFEPGDVVFLKSGGQAMTVAAVDEDNIECLWIGEEGELFRETIPGVALTAAPDDDEDEEEEEEEEDEDGEDDDEDEETSKRRSA